jgi:hypothetical protein
MCPKRFPSVLHDRRKLCTYVASRLALSLNGPKQASICRRHLGGPTGVAKKIFRAHGIFGANREPILR